MVRGEREPRLRRDQSSRLRLFVACELPPEVKEGLATVQRDLRARGAERLRYVRPEGIHVTLKFLGEVPASRRPAIEEALRAAVAEPPGLRLRLGRLGGFGGRQGLRVVWVGLEGDTEGLRGLASRVEAALEPLGFPPEGRPFAAHLTLARVPESAGPEDRLRLAEAIEGCPLPDVPAFEVERVSLMQSILDPGGAIYRRLAAFPEEEKVGRLPRP